jgi:hypothetical protein
MRSVKEYLTYAAYFETPAAPATDAALKKRFADLAERYRLLAAERETAHRRRNDSARQRAVAATARLACVIVGSTIL